VGKQILPYTKQVLEQVLNSIATIVHNIVPSSACSHVAHPELACEEEISVTYESPVQRGWILVDCNQGRIDPSNAG
jgi:hypothetical protein